MVTQDLPNARVVFFSDRVAVAPTSVGFHDFMRLTLSE